MKRVILLLFATSTFACYAQQDGTSSSEGFNTFRYNPASYGALEKFSANVQGRLLYVGLSGSRRLLAANVGGKFRSLQTSSNRTGIFLGTNFQFDDYDDLSYLQWNIDIGYSLGFGNSALRFAVSPGLFRLGFTTYIIDPYYPYNSGYQTKYDMQVGMMYTWKTFYAGFSINHLTAPRMDSLGFQIVRQYYSQFGYKIPIGEYYVYPMLSLNATQGGFSYQSINYFVYKKELFSVGVGYRAGGTIIFGAVGQLKGFRLGYYYDLDTSPLSKYNKGSHEMRLTYFIPYDN
ncbi:MAG: PorP/SprF family type IX secretion system membrane protein [Crocinitomicaceae bacterium]|nr:PorP/SprF family type IX secretion system membrane protein [Crocinitomicaceae bacterium]